jgi:hypothetical protein
VACVWQNAKVPGGDYAILVEYFLHFQIDIRAAQTGEIRAKEQFEGGELAKAFLADLAAAGPLDSGEEQPQLTMIFRNGQGKTKGKKLTEFQFCVKFVPWNFARIQTHLTKTRANKCAKLASGNMPSWKS